ncbi:MAG: thymidine phosphorylase, partial [Pirellulaceae bacterium]
MNAAKIISDKRDGKRIADDDLADLIAAYTQGQVPDYQMAAFAMAVFFQGMEPAEVVTLTHEMLASGQIMKWHGFDKPVIDKHSTGGVGDKIS